MSIQNTITVQCTKCNSDIEATHWQSLNGDINPEGKKALLDGSLFSVTCKKCGEIIRLKYPMLYNDMKHSTMVFLVDSEDDIEDTINIIKMNEETLLGTKEISFRIVWSHNALREKALIFDNGLDDRVIELVKFMQLVQLYRKYPDKLVDNVYFNIEDEKYLLLFFLNGENLMTGSFEIEQYTEIQELIISNLEEKSKDQYIIDQKWARSFFD